MTNDFESRLTTLLPEGVEYDYVTGKKHDKLWLHRGDESRMVVMSKTASDRRALQNQLRDVKYALRALGALQ